MYQLEYMTYGDFWDFFLFIYFFTVEMKSSLLLGVLPHGQLESSACAGLHIQAGKKG